MTLSDSDRLLVNDGSETNTITFAQFKDGSVLNPTDLFLVNDGVKTETISWEQIEDELGPKGEVVTPTVLKPKDGAGSGDERYLKTDKITKVEGGGVITCETEEIESVDAYTPTTYSFSCYNQNPSDSINNAKALNAVDFDNDSDTYTENNIAIGVKPSNRQTHAYFGRYTFDKPVQLEWGLLNSTSKIHVTYFRSDNPNGPWTLDNSYITNQDSNTLSKDASKYWVVVNGTDAYYSNPNVAPSNKDIAFNTDSWGVRLVPPNITLTFPSAQGFDCFEPGDVVQGPAVALGEEYKQAISSSSETTLPSPSSISGWQNTALGESSFNVDANIIYAEFNVATTPIFTRYLAGGSAASNQILCHWNGSSWIVDDSVDGVISTSNFLQGQTKARYWCAFRSGTAFSIGSQVTSFSDSGLPWSAGAFVFGAEDTQVKVISKDDSDPYTITVDGGKWDTSNQDEVWSNGSGYTGTGDSNESSYSTLTGGGFTGKTGDLGTNGVGTDDLFGCNNGTATWIGSVSYTESVAMWCYTNPDASWKFTIDGAVYDVTSQVPVSTGGNPGAKTTFTGLPASGTITKFEIVATNTAKGKGFTGWYLDNKLLVDAVNDSQVWSNSWSAVTGTIVDPTKAFDGITENTSFTKIQQTGGTAEGYIEFDPPISGSSVGMFINQGGNTTQVYYSINNDSSYVNSYTDGSFSEQTASVPGNSLSRIYFKRENLTDPAHGVYISAIRAGGKLLLNKGTDRGLGDNKLVKETPYDTKLTVAGPTDLADMTGSVFMTDGQGAPGPYTQTPYLVTSDSIVSVGTDGATTIECKISKTSYTANWSDSGNIDKGSFAFGSFGTNDSDVAQCILYKFDIASTSAWRFYTASAPSGTFVVEGSTDGNNWVTVASGSMPGLNDPPGLAGGPYEYWRLTRPGTTNLGWYAYAATGSGLTTLTLSGDTDLAYFRVNDVVQGLAVAPGDKYELSTSDSTTTLAYDDSSVVKLGDYEYGTTPSDSVQKVQFYYDLGVALTNVHIVRYDGLYPGTANFTLYGSNDRTSTSWTQLVTGTKIDDGTDPSVTQYISGSTPYRYLLFDSGSAGGIITDRYGIEENIFDNNKPPVKVVSIDDSVPSITVDGGEWDTSNQSQVWSNYAVNNGERPWSQAFDGNLDNGTFNNSATSNYNPTPVVWEYTGETPLTFNTLRIYYYQGHNGSNDKGDLFVNGQNLGPTLSINGWDWTTVNLSTSSGATSETQLEKIELTGGATRLMIVAAIELDGKLLVDAAKDSQVWSENTTVTGPAPVPEHTADKAFNGSTDVADGYWYAGNGGGSQLVTFTPAITYTSKIEVFTWTSLNGTFVVNGTDITANINSDGVAYPGNWLDISAYFTGNTVNTIEITKAATQTSPAIVAIRVDGKLLLDQGVRDLGDTEVKYQTNGGQGTIVEVNTDDNTLLIKDLDSNTRDNRWIAENGAGIDFAVAGPTIVDSPLLTTNVELESSQFATTPADVDGLKEIIWNINGADQSAGTNNPYRPTGLPLNSEVTIKVKHVANSIGESEWSASTKFTTGASRSLKDHYVKQIRELEQQLAAAQGTKTRSVDTGDRKRARNADGTYRGDDPSTPDVNEAWEGGEEPPAKGKRKGKKR